MRNSLVVIAVTIACFLSGCQMAPLKKDDFKKYSDKVLKQYPIGSDEKLLVKDLSAQGYRLSGRTRQIDGVYGWQGFIKYQNGGVLPSLCLNEYHVNWLSDEGGMITQIKVYGFSDCAI